METKTALHKGANIIKVVNLKRFFPDTYIETKPKFKPTWYNPISSINASHNSTSTDSKCTEENNEKSVIDITKNPIQVKDNSLSDTQNSQCSQIKVQTARKNKITFRSCSHSDKELSTLHEHFDNTLVKVGDTFESRDTLKQYLNDNARRWHYYYVCRTSRKQIIEYNCICMAYNNKERAVVIRRQKKRTTACPCKIRLTVNQSTNKVTVYYVCNHHDHETTASAFFHYPHAKYLPHVIKEEFLDLTYLGLDVDLIQKYVYAVTGLTLKKKDIWSYSYRFKKKIFQRTLSNERRKYMEDLIIKIGEKYNALDISSMEQSVNTIETNPTAANDLIINQEDSLLNEVINSEKREEVIIQYITEEGILCDENGTPITNSSAIIQFINNYETRPQIKEECTEDGNIFSELVDSIHEDVYPIDWEAIQAKSLKCSAYCERLPYGEETVYVKNENIEPIDVFETQIVETGVTNVQDQRLSPTRKSPPAYAEMDNFNKYYYVDHRYVMRLTDYTSNDEQKLVQYKSRFSKFRTEGRNPDIVREEYIKASSFSYLPACVRYCTGHDRLTLHVDSDVIMPGAKFLTHDVFLTYINERANRWFFYYSMVESGKCPENYVYKCVYGKHRVSKNAYRAKGLRKRNNMTTQCPCQIRLRRIEGDSDYLTVLYSCNHHDHPLNERQFTLQNHSRRLPAHIKEEVKDLLALRVSADILRKYVTSETGVRVYPKYFHNVRVAMQTRREQRHFTEERLQALTKKIRDLEAIYGNAAKENPQTRVSQNQIRKRVLAPSHVLKEDRCTQIDMEDAGTLTLGFYELSDKDDFAEEVCIVDEDICPMEDTARRLETRLQNLSHQEVLMKVKKLQESVRRDNPGPLQNSMT